MPSDRPLHALFAAAAASLVLGLPAVAKAQCCQGYSPVMACDGAGLTKSRWCVQDSVPNAQSALPKEFCGYGDKVVSTLETVFNSPAKDVFEFELDAQTGGAHTGTSCGHLGDGVAYDGFVGSAYGATGFWGYLLSLHEAINDWTGMSSSGWPTDFWADHQSAFPNVMDFHVMNTIGTAGGDQNLIKAAAAQKKRFYPMGDSADAKVVALDNVFMAMPNGDGYGGFSEMFALQSGDGVKWDGLGVPNPDVKRSEYVAGYMSLAVRRNVLALLQGPGANGGGNICNGTPDGTAADKPYTCDAGQIDAIATAHCSIAANGKRAADLSALRRGDYTNVPSGPCGDACPAECACDTANHCVASWLGHVSGAGNTGGAGGAFNTGGTDGGIGAGGRIASGGTAGSAGTAGNGGIVAQAGGAIGSGGATAEKGGVTANGGASSVDSGTTSDGGKSKSGCGCRVAAAARREKLGSSLWFFGLGAIAVARRRRYVVA